MTRAGNDNDGWTSEPPDGEGTKKWEILRAPRKSWTELIILSPNQIGKQVHFWGNRTVPHTEENCRACAESRRLYWEGYLACYDRIRRYYVVFAYTARIGQQIKNKRAELSHLKGQVIRIGREGDRQNGQIWLQWKEPIEDCATLPIAPDLRPILERMWQAPSKSTAPKIDIVKPRLAPTGTEGDLGNEQTD